MKRFLGLCIGILFATSANAQMPGYNFIHTGGENGYFQIELSLDDYHTPLQVEDIFVINYPTKQQSQYRDILRTIQNFGGTVITNERFEKTHAQQTLKRYVFLGKTRENFLTFQAPKEESLEAFDNFLVTELLPVYMSDVELKFGGNVYDLYPPKIQFMHDRNNIIVGRFKKSMKTRLELRANTPHGYIITNTILDFSNPIYTTDVRVNYLDELWEEAKQVYDTHTKQKLSRFIQWSNVFPIVLFVLGVFVILFGLLMFGRRMKEESLLPHDFWDDAPETVIDNTDKEIIEDDNLPFEVHLRKHENQ